MAMISKFIKEYCEHIQNEVDQTNDRYMSKNGSSDSDADGSWTDKVDGMTMSELLLSMEEFALEKEENESRASAT